MKLSRGFTLLEMIVAIGIFAVIATISFASLNRFLDDQARLESRMDEIKKLQLAFTIVEQDMQYLAQRPVRDGFGDAEPAFIMSSPQSLPDELVRFTTYQRNSAVPGVSRLMRAAYRFEDDQLYRVNWQVLDRDQDSVEVKRILLSGLRDASLSLLVTSDNETQSKSEWTDPEQLPDGVELRLVMDDGREYRRVFEVKHAQ